MIADRYVLVVWASVLLVPWAAIYAAFPPYRRAMRWSSAFALPFGISETLFAGKYWSPPSLFDLARRLHVDVESFVFLFAAGGVASVAYNVVLGRPIEIGARAKRPRLREAYNAGLAAPALVFSPALIALHVPIRAGLVALAVGAIARLVCRPDLLAKTVCGGALFLALYVLLLESLVRLQPGYVERVWAHDGPLFTRVSGIPVSELLFGGTFGAYWSGLYEHWHWTFAPRLAR